MVSHHGLRERQCVCRGGGAVWSILYRILHAIIAFPVLETFLYVLES